MQAYMGIGGLSVDTDISRKFFNVKKKLNPNFCVF